MKSNLIPILAITLPLSLSTTACKHKSGIDDANGNASVMFVGNKDRGWLGVSVEDVTDKLVRKKGLKVNDGAYVSDVQEDSPAEAAGLKEGDVIVTFDGETIRDRDDLIDEVRRVKPGTEVNIGVARGVETQTLKASVGSSPRMRTFSFRAPHIPRMRIAPRLSFSHESIIYGLTLEGLDKQLAEYFGAPDGKGVLVKNVKRNSKAEQAGFKAGDVIVKIGDERVFDADDVWHELDDIQEGEKAEIEVLRKGSSHKLQLTIEKRERPLGFDRFNGDDDVILDLFSPEEADKLHNESERLKNELKNLQNELHDGMIDLKHNLQQQLQHLRRSVNT